MDNIKQVLELIKSQKTPNPHSLKHCHCPNVSSIILKEEAGKLKRVFLCFPDHNLWMNGQRRASDKVYSVAFHDHKYDLTLDVLTDNVWNVSLKPGGVDSYTRYKVTSRLKEGLPPEIKFDRAEYSLSLHMERFSELKLSYRDIHTIYVPYKEKAAWIVEEGETKQETTNLFLPVHSFPINYCGLYEKFESRDELVAHIEDFIHV